MHSNDGRFVFSRSVSHDLAPHVSYLMQVRLHPILKQTKMFVSSIRRREHLASGFPLLSSTGVTVTQSVISLLYKLQEKQPWAQAIGSVRVTYAFIVLLFMHALYYIFNGDLFMNVM